MNVIYRTSREFWRSHGKVENIREYTSLYCQPLSTDDYIKIADLSLNGFSCDEISFFLKKKIFAKDISDAIMMSGRNLFP